MFRSHLRLVVLSAVLALGPAIGGAAEPPVVGELPIEGFVFFGDSLTDNGKVFANPSPPYWFGRYSNGPTWAELLSARLGMANRSVVNRAYSGERSDQMMARVETYKFQAGAIPANRLCLFFIGTNDYRQIVLAREPNVEADTSTVVNNIVASIRKVHDAGCRRILVVNLPDLSLFPEFRGRVFESRMAPLVKRHNERLAQVLPGLALELSSKIDLHEASRLFDMIRLRPNEFGFTEVDNRCYFGGFGTCGSPDTTLFFDFIHLNSRWNQLLAEKVAQQIDPWFAPAPEQWILW